MSILRSSRFGLPRIKPLSSKRSHIVSVLDIGSTKVVCVIGKLTPNNASSIFPARTHSIEIIGIGYQKSRGVKTGVIVDLEAIEIVIRQAVEVAERMAELTVDSLIVNVSLGRLSSSVYSASVDLSGQEVEASDIRKVLSVACQQSIRKDHAILHSMAVGYSLDGERGIRFPLSMFGEKLGVDIHVVSAELTALKNLELAVNRAHLSIEGMVATPYASGLACLVDDEIELGCAIIDMGGGVTTVAVFIEGRLVHSDAIAIGGHHITTDLARGLSLRIDDAERLKVMHASVIASSSDEYEVISINPIRDNVDDQPVQVSRALVSHIVRARIEETLELIGERIQRSGFSSLVGKRVVLTGGASQITGLPDLARRILARNVRIGRPVGVSGLPQAAKGPAFATAVGLMVYPQVVTMETHIGDNKNFSFGNQNNKFSLVGQWLRKSF
ncbi:Cell division protein FtsA [Liberibacter crescens BT-1]|uniref:Cell division protein FtsA n=1 Tax=Liberibacter crescens (strain BT-1) TaxID=1215343 RepID=L0EVB6_LIBCB|nr:cell division protein FtsA [Liberibacter crescens]AGA64588.1 Cell division protein FtsA [Liberibacter crescens BT-1]AMC12720.1 cell division protein FtsA [Liberibacter crescens]